MRFTISQNKFLTVQIFCLLILFLPVAVLLPQTIDEMTVQYVSPKPGSVDNSPENNIIISLKNPVETGYRFSSDILKVTGEKSGRISGKFILSENNRTLVFTPYKNFAPGEMIKVDLSGLLSSLGNFSTKNYFNFFVAEKFPQNNKYSLKLYLDEIGITEKEFKEADYKSDRSFVLDSLPPNYPDFTIEKIDNPYKENLFMSLFGSGGIPANMIIENDGNPIYYNELPSAGIDFKKQPDGTITYFDTEKGKFYAINSLYEIVDSFYCGNGFETDLHELLVLPDGSSYLLGLDPRIIDMSLIVPGGKPDAEVIGFLIQELDANKNVVFQWKSLDYIPVTDASPSIDLTAQVIDYVHSNSICVDFDGNLLLSSRHLDEITKINKQTGEIIWRLGGKENEFDFINENYQFSHQHDVRRIANGDILFFDNGNLRSPAFSRAVEYDVNVVQHTATLVWQYINFPYYVTNAMGSARRLPNGNTLIDWVRAGYITEVRPDGSLALKIKYPADLYSYRVIKDDWQATLFTTTVDTLDFGDVGIGNISSQATGIINNSEHPVTITGIFHTNDAFSINEIFPLVIPSHNQANIEISFSPSSAGQFADILNIRSVSETNLVNRQMIVTGSGINISGTKEGGYSHIDYKLFQNYPNPFNPSTKISWQLARKSFVTIKVFDVLGNKVTTLVKKELPAGKYEKRFDPENLNGEYTSGVYFYSIKAVAKENGSAFVETKKMIYLK